MKGFTEEWVEEQRKQGRTVEDMVYGRTASKPKQPTNGKRRKPRRNREHEMQQAFVDLCAYKEAEYPELIPLYANANGQYRPGQRMEAGLKSGVPDLFLACASSGYHGLYLELKAPGGRLSKNQERWIKILRGQGFAVRVAWSLDQAWKITEAYLNEEL